jgi:hypothetical protein
MAINSQVLELIVEFGLWFVHHSQQGAKEISSQTHLSLNVPIIRNVRITHQPDHGSTRAFCTNRTLAQQPP